MQTFSPSSTILVENDIMNRTLFSSHWFSPPSSSADVLYSHNQRMSNKHTKSSLGERRFFCSHSSEIFRFGRSRLFDHQGKVRGCIRQENLRLVEFHQSTLIQHLQAENESVAEERDEEE